MMKDSANPYDDLLSWMKRNHINGDEEQRLRYLIDRIHEWKNSSRPEFQLRQNSDELAVGFAEWIRDNGYVKYWGSDEPNNEKWYIHYSQPRVRKYFTTAELLQLYKLSPEFKARPEVKQETK